MQIHSAYFNNQYGTVSLMLDILRGIDRTVLTATNRTVGALWPVPA